MTGTADRPGFGARFTRAIGNLVLALVNATLLLFIAAAVFGLVLLDRTRTIAADVAGDVTRSAIASTGLDPSDTLAELRVVSQEMVQLKTAIQERGSDIDERTQALSARLDKLQATLGSLEERKEGLAEAAIEKASIVAGNALERMRGCTPSEPAS